MITNIQKFVSTGTSDFFSIINEGGKVFLKTLPPLVAASIFWGLSEEVKSIPYEKLIVYNKLGLQGAQYAAMLLAMKIMWDYATCKNDNSTIAGRNIVVQPVQPVQPQPELIAQVNKEIIPVQKDEGLSPETRKRRDSI